MISKSRRRAPWWAVTLDIVTIAAGFIAGYFVLVRWAIDEGVDEDHVINLFLVKSHADKILGIVLLRFFTFLTKPATQSLRKNHCNG